jgi:Stress responsive A/B Barrel Domain
MKGVVPGTVFYLIRERGFCYYTYVCTGIISLEVGAPQDLASTKGFDFGLVLCLEDQEAFEVFLTHPAHIRYVSRMNHPQ